MPCEHPLATMDQGNLKTFRTRKATAMEAQSVEAQMKVIDHKMELYNQKQEAQNTLVKLMKSIEELKNQLPSSSYRIGNRNDQDDNLESRNGNGNDHRRPGIQGFRYCSCKITQVIRFTPKLEFLKFDGQNSRSWIKKCCRYFELCKIPNEQMVDLASLHVLDKGG